VRVAGSRWTIEEGFAAGEELAGLDDHQVRCWTSWHRWTILAMLAHAFLSVLTASQPDDGHANDDQLIPLTRNEIRRLFTGLRPQQAAPSSSWTGHGGDAATKPPPASASTGDEPSPQHDHEVSFAVLLKAWTL
jgi:hypothetical protein